MKASPQSKDPKPIYDYQKIDGKQFMLSEKLDSYQDAQVAAAEYRCEGLFVRVEPIIKDMLYYIWTHPGRTRMPRLLPGEKVKRVKRHKVMMVRKH